MPSPPPWYGLELLYIVMLIAVALAMGHIVLTI